MKVFPRSITVISITVIIAGILVNLINRLFAFVPLTSGIRHLLTSGSLLTTLVLLLLVIPHHQAAADIVVTNTNDSGAGSLRQAIADVTPGGNISFDASLNGQTIILAGNQLGINKSLTIDASLLSDGIIVSGNNASRVFRIFSGNVVMLNQLTIIQGNSNGA